MAGRYGAGDGRGEVRIGADPARSLPDSDPTGRDLALGLGAFVESYLIVAAEAGLAVDAVTGARAGRAARAGAAGVRHPVHRRGSCRPGGSPGAGSRPGPVPSAVLTSLEPGVVHVPGLELAADLAVADRWLFATPVVARELRDWLRLHPRHPRYTSTG